MDRILCGSHSEVIPRAGGGGGEETCSYYRSGKGVEKFSVMYSLQSVSN